MLLELRVFVWMIKASFRLASGKLFVLRDCPQDVVDELCRLDEVGPLDDKPHIADLQTQARNEQRLRQFRSAYKLS